MTTPAATDPRTSPDSAPDPAPAGSAPGPAAAPAQREARPEGGDQGGPDRDRHSQSRHGPGRPDLRDLLGLSVDPADGSGSMVVAPHLRNAGGALWGGCGVAAAVAVAQAALGRGCVWATAQFVSPILAGQRLDLRLEAGRHGGGLSQAAVRGTVGDRVALLVTGAFGGSGVRLGFTAPSPGLAEPLAGTPRRFPEAIRDRIASSILGRVEQRWALPPRTEFDGTPGTGRSALWVRLREPAGVPVDSALLAMFGDFALAALPEAVGELTYAVSLDNSVRITGEASTDWVLLDISVEAVFRDIAHVSARMFDEDGTLVAVATQSAMVRRLVDGRRRRLTAPEPRVQPS